MTIDYKNPVLIDMPMPIVTPRLTIRPVMPGDGAAIYDAKMETWDDLARWMPFARERGTAESDEIMARKAFAKFLLREDFMMIACDRADGRPLVFTGLHRFDWAARRFEIGYWCRKSAQGQGFVTENANALARYAFNVLGARAVAIDYAHDNERSAAVAKRLGFEYEGTMKNALLTPNDVMHDRIMCSITGAGKLPPMDVRWGAVS